MKTPLPALLLLFPLLLAGLPAAAQTRPAGRQPPPPSPPAAAPANAATASVPSTPQQTTASFGDWVLRCTRPGPAPAPAFCEVAQTVQREDRPVAQVALGRPAKGQPMQLTVLVPPSVSFSAPATLSAPREGDGATELAWRRCLPGGCTADASLPDDAVARLRGWAEPARITFTDAAGRTAALPFSPRGLSQALDALAKEE